MKEIYPANKAHFLKLIPFAKRIIGICKEEGITPVIYGSFAHFYWTKDRKMKVNDIDMYIPEKSFKKIASKLKKAGIKFKYEVEWHSMQIMDKNPKVIVELDSMEEYYVDSYGRSMPRNFNKFDFYGEEEKILGIDHLAKLYVSAYNRSQTNKSKIINKIRHLENHFGGNLKNDIQLEIIKNKDLSQTQKDIINNARVSHWGEENRKDFKRDYEPDTDWLFIKDKNKTVALAGLRPITINYLGKKYGIRGICSVISLVKGKGYGQILVSFMIDYSIRTGKTLLGFTTQTKFFKKAGLETKKSFTWRFALKNPKTKEVKFDSGDCDGIYYDGKDKFISKVLSTKSIVYYYIPNLDDPHW